MRTSAGHIILASLRRDLPPPGSPLPPPPEPPNSGPEPPPPQPTVPGGPIAPPVTTNENSNTFINHEAGPHTPVVLPSSSPTPQTTHLSSSSGHNAKSTTVFTSLESLTTQSDLTLSSSLAPMGVITPSLGGGSGVGGPTVTSHQFQPHAESTRRWILPLALILPILLICSGLLALHKVRRGRTQSVYYFKKSTSTSPMQSERCQASREAVSASLPIHEASLEIVEMVQDRDTMAIGIGADPHRDDLPSMLTLVSISGDGDGQEAFSSCHFLEDSTPSRDHEMEVLRERLRVIENLALSLSDHAMGDDDLWSLRQELRELVIPPPEYTNIGRET